MDYTVHGVAKSQMGLSDFHFHFHFRCKSKLYLVDSFLKQNILWECKESACSVGDLGLMSGLGRSPIEGKGYPLQYSGLENSMDSIVHGVAKSQTRLSS